MQESLLSKMYREVEEIADCLKKKEYYEKLKEHKPKMSEKDREFI